MDLPFTGLSLQRRENMDKKILQMAEAIKALGPWHQWLLLKTLFAGFGVKKRIQWFNWVCRLTYPEKRWWKLERWMEGMFRRDMKRTPRMVAAYSTEGDQ